ncbi:enolase C-terminal domain-like protein [Pontibacter litorisediminis]|uniref:enolase C-terminal domain-like protein n=1 Tax=Pontibacter litorisediminis TaxID=1846260 RepID=UPI0023EB0366|nr:enolase C-terminal domain-like protein [Pontibacter litorisediminis]
MLKWHIEVLHLKLKPVAAPANGTPATRVNFLVQVSDGEFSGFGEAAPDARYGETPELLLQQYKVLLMGGLPQVQRMEELLQLLEEHPPINALRFAIEAAYLHYFCQHKGIPVHQLLGQPVPQPQATCFSLPTLEPEEVHAYLAKYDLTRFRYLKLKVDPEQGLDLVEEVVRATEQPLVLEGHESWLDPEELLDFLHSLERGRILFMEQPMPVAKAAAYAQIKNISPIPLVADESVTDIADFELLRTQFHGVSIAPMRAGGYLNTVRLLQEAKKNSLMTVLSTGIETSLGTWSAMQLSSAFNFVVLDGFLMLEDEPFGLVLEREGILYLK